MAEDLTNTSDATIGEKTTGVQTSRVSEPESRNTVLIVNDVQDHLDLYSFLLRRSGYRILTAADGQTGLETARKYHPDLIISDVSMPVMNGIEMCRTIRQDAELKTIPILLVSGVLTDSQTIVEGLNAGAEDYLEIPCDPIVLVTKAARLIERKHAEEKLYESEERYRGLVENARDILYSQDLEGNYLSVNKVAEQILGYTLEEAVQMNQKQILAPEYYETARSMISRKLAGENIATYELEAVTKDGRRLSFETNSWLVYRNEVPVGVQGIARDITERKHSEIQLRQSEERYRLLFESNPQPMWVYDIETLAFLEVNDAAIHHYGYSRDEFLSMTIKDIRPPADVPALLDTILQEPNPYVAAKVWRHRKKDGTIVDVELTAHSFTFNDRPARLIQVMDITVRRSLEDQLRHAQKMEAIGHLAGGVAHDFNNLLTAINGYSDLALRKLPPNNLLQQYIEEIKKASELASTLTRQLLTFSRRHTLQTIVLNLNLVVSEMEKMLRRLIGESVELRAVLEPELGNIKADAGQIEQVVMNLVVNARDAMPEGGKLTIETKNVFLDESYTMQHLGVRPGHYAMLAISDTGTGMDDERQKRIFEPFFTTKEPGKGTGLGLSTVYGIVKQSGGSIWVYSEIERGTTFKIYFPLIEDRMFEPEPPAGTEKDLNGTETILLVEDEEIVRNLVRETLENYGYKVLEASNGADGLSIYEQYPESINLLLTDSVMPGMGGNELAKALLKICPQIKVLFMSGYTDQIISNHGILDENTNFIQKPFTPQTLARAVRETLDETKTQEDDSDV
jgi:two-component system, cell cycle sensor histidine kinase and response regulator CckA